ncbi:MAG: hypothetical protein IJV25_07760 [Prevotella sp.]|nr:hypothetical protein [Prevotella sp.]
MNYNHPLKNGSTVTIRVMCAIVFVLFSFCWLYFFQADQLAMSQHVLSGGLTRYNPIWGALIITLVLMLLQLLVNSFAKLTKRSHALTYVPSMMLLALVTEVSQQIETNGAVSLWTWILPLFVLAVWGVCIWAARIIQDIESDRDFSLFSRPMWINALLMALQIICVAWIANTNAVYHYRMQTETLLADGKYQKALEVGRYSHESDANLLMLRMYALARQNALGEKLFEYPITADVEQILPTSGRTRMYYCAEDSLYRFLGGRPAEPMSPMHFLDLLERRDSVASRQVADYKLCGLLIDRQIDRFAREISRYYALDDRLPKHYREALVLYTHLRSNPVVVYHHAVTDEDWRNLQELESRYPDFTERKGRVEDQYRTTYWYYYEYLR